MAGRTTQTTKNTDIVNLDAFSPDPLTNVADAVPPTTDIVLRQAIVSIQAVGGPRPEGNLGATAFQFTVTRAGNTAIPASVDWRVLAAAGASADAADFIGGMLPSGTVAFAAGETSKTITVLAAADNQIEADETFSVQLSANDTSVAIAQDTASATILNDDSHAELRISAGGAPADSFMVLQEHDTGQVTYKFDIHRSGDLNRATTANWHVAPSGAAPAAGTDFAGGVPPSGAVFFAPGETVKTVTVLVAGDTKVETNETFDVVISTPNNDATVMKSTATGVIVNDDHLSELYIHPANSQDNQFVVKQEGNAGATQYSFEIFRSGDVDRVTAANWKVTPSGAHAANAADFMGNALPSGTAVFGMGEFSKIVTIQVAGDKKFENDETFDVVVTTASPDSIVVDGTATGVIINDDKLSELYIASGETDGFETFIVKNEGDAGVTQYKFRIDRAMDIGRVTTVDWNVTPSAVNPVSISDFAGGAFPSGTVTFAVGETQKFVTIKMAGDTKVEANEAFDIVLSNPSADSVVMKSTATGVLINDDHLSELYIHPKDSPGDQFVVKKEGDAGSTQYSFEIFRSGDVDRVTAANWKVTPSGAHAANAADFMGNVLPSGTAVFGMGEFSKIVTIQVAGDKKFENDETFEVVVTTASPDSVVIDGTAAGVIVNDDKLSELYIASGETDGFETFIVKAEGDAGVTQYTFRIDRAMDAGRVTTVDWHVTPSAVNPVSTSDFTGGAFPSGTVTFAVGETQKFVTIKVAGDTKVETNESFDIVLSNPSADSVVMKSTATGAIMNDDSPSKLSILPGEPALFNYFVSKAEGNAGATQYTYAIHRGGELGRVTVADWHVAPTGVNPASASDFIGGLPSGSVVFNAGESTKLIAVNVHSDGTAEADESFQVVLSTSSADAEVTQATAGGIILNDDQPGVVSIAALTPHRTEGDRGLTPFTFVVTRTGDTATQASAHWQVSGDANNGANAADFGGGLPPSGTVTFAAGQQSQTIAVNVNGDTQFEADETFFVTLSNASPSLIIGAGSAASTIVNDDTGRVPAGLVSTGLASPAMSFMGGSDPATPPPAGAIAPEDVPPPSMWTGGPELTDFTGELAGAFWRDVPDAAVLAGMANWLPSENPAYLMPNRDLLA